MNSNIIERLRRWTGGPGRPVLWSIQCLIPSEGSSPWCQVEGLKPRQQKSQGIKSKKRWVTTEKGRIYQPCNFLFSQPSVVVRCLLTWVLWFFFTVPSNQIFNPYRNILKSISGKKKTCSTSLLGILNSVNVTHKLNFFHKTFQESARWLSAWRRLQYKPSDLGFVPGTDIKMVGENQSPNVDHTR